jgi:hypothetical protein
MSAHAARMGEHHTEHDADARSSMQHRAPADASQNESIE